MKLCASYLGLFLIFGLMLSSCLGGETSVVTKNTSYRVLMPKTPWTTLSVSRLDADYAFQNTKTGSAFYVRSACNLYKDASLNQLTTGLLRLFDSPAIIHQETGTLAKREAQRTVLTGKMDGASVKSKITILKKNACTFDFVFVSIPKFYAQDVTAYEDFLKSFQL